MNIFSLFNKAKDIFKYVVWGLILIFIGCSVFNINILKFFGILGLSYQDIVIVILLSLLSLVLEIDLESINNKLRKTNLKLNDFFLLASGNSIFIKPEEHPYIWEDFVGSYYAVNAPWVLEKNSKEEYEKMIEKHKFRYLDERMINTYYVFFTKSKYKDSLKNFYSFIKRIYEEIPDVLDKKIRIIIVDEEAPNYTLFIGEKPKNVIIEHKYKSIDKVNNDYVDYSILYISDKPFVTNVGMPNWSIVTINSPLNEVLINQVKNYIFSDEYSYFKLNGEVEIKVSEFIKNFEQIQNYIEKS